MVIFKIYDITEWTTNNCNTRIVHYVKKQWKADNDIGQLMEYNMKNVFLGKLYTKCGREASRRPFYKNQNRAYL